MKKILFLIFVISIVFTSCSQKIKCKNPKSGKMILVAYRVSKHSHLWFRNISTNQIYNISGVGGRREPTINLGDTINMIYCDDNKVIFNKYNYVQIPSNRDTRFVFLNDYSYLYP